MHNTSQPYSFPPIQVSQEPLTPEQEAHAHQFFQERMAAMLSPDTINESEAEEHLRQAYLGAGLEPVQVHWFDSPMAFIQADFSTETHLWGRFQASKWVSARLGNEEKLRARIGTSVLQDNLQKSFRKPDRDRIWRSIGNSIHKHSGSNIGFKVQMALQECLREDDPGKIWHYVPNYSPMETFYSIEEIVPRAIEASSENSVQAYLDAFWYVWYRLYYESEQHYLIHLARFNEMVSGYRLGSKEAWLVRKPIHLSLDEQGYPHSSSRMAIEYPDGWGFYAWHGKRCHEQVILYPEQITRDDWVAEPNVEVRRVIQDRLGQARFMALVGGTCIDSNQHGELIAVDLGNDPERVAHYLHIQDAATEPEGYRRVPPSIRQVNAALAWVAEVGEQEYVLDQGLVY
jgi:hypothetical protein